MEDKGETQRGCHTFQGDTIMLRAMFVAIGVFVCLVGVECLFVEKAVFAQLSEAPPEDPWNITEATPEKREITLPDWAPFTLLAGGVVTIIYSFTIPRRIGG